jgi:glycosyltransferase involved in cell wall biosynthesis
MEHAKGWVRAGHEVTWLTASYPGAKKESTVESVKFVRRWGSNTVYLYAPLYLIANARFFDVIIDEVHGFPFFSPLFTRKPVVVFIHEIAGEIWDYMFPFPKNVIGKILEWLYFRLYRHCLFWTDAPSTVSELVQRGIPSAQCTAISCPLIKRSTFNGRRFKKEKNPTFIFVSRVVRMKGIEEIIKAFSFIVQTDHTAKLWIVGSGEPGYINELKRMMSEYGIMDHVTLFGNISDKRKFELMSRAHLLLHASVKEGWGLVVLEAASVGTPAIVYNVAGLKDVVHDGKTGLVIKDSSPQSMAKEAVRLTGDRRRYNQYQQNGYIWVRSLHWKDAVRQSLRVIMNAYYDRPVR